MIGLLGGNEWRLCHGVAVGRGPIEGVRFGHAWVENERFVIDNGGIVLRSTYYMTGQIRPAEVKRWTKHEATIEVLKQKYYGPWNQAIVEAEKYLNAQ